MGQESCRSCVQPHNTLQGGHILPILWMSTLRLGKFKRLREGFTTNEWKQTEIPASHAHQTLELSPPNTTSF